MIVKQNITNPESFLYLRDQLGLGKSLSNNLSMLPIEKGTVFAFVPAGIAEERLLNFKIGGIYPIDTALRNKERVTPIRNDSRPLIVKEILQHIHSSESNCCLFEDALTLPSDPWVINSNIEYLSLMGDELLYYFDNNSCSEEKVINAFNVSESYTFLCALGSLGIEERRAIASHNNVSLELVRAFIENVSAFFVRAYDGEGYLMWTPA
jgi:hypothetical protein